ncbi:UNKNOWN [Stylonychia lemnae]|uniref:Uncharacterized protein n=1 Tax=Stylonychia lemnae TaxID=5949 RepID=A0A078B1Z1_STYLE|nr:UNKNOWN [Stylonychia lemnae]|eukprot:CDW87363.1 UNKNOWN [Stylonychia lemnae]
MKAHPLAKIAQLPEKMRLKYFTEDQQICKAQINLTQKKNLLISILNQTNLISKHKVSDQSLSVKGKPKNNTRKRGSSTVMENTKFTQFDKKINMTTMKAIQSQMKKERWFGMVESDFKNKTHNDNNSLIIDDYNSNYQQSQYLNQTISRNTPSIMHYRLQNQRFSTLNPSSRATNRTLGNINNSVQKKLNEMNEGDDQFTKYMNYSTYRQIKTSTPGQRKKFQDIKESVSKLGQYDVDTSSQYIGFKSSPDVKLESNDRMSRLHSTKTQILSQARNEKPLNIRLKQLKSIAQCRDNFKDQKQKLKDQEELFLTDSKFYMRKCDHRNLLPSCKYCITSRLKEDYGYQTQYL